MKRVALVVWNWRFSNKNGEEFDSCEPAKKGVERIEYHAAAGPGDQHYCDIHMEDGKTRRVFNLNEVVFEKEEE